MREYVLRDFRLYFPYLANQIVRERWVGPRTVIFDLEDGSVIRYNHSLNAIRVLKEYDGTEEEWRKEFSRRLYETMADRAIGQDLLAEKTGISQKSISKYLHCEAVPSAYVASKLAKALECTPNDLIKYD